MSIINIDKINIDKLFKEVRETGMQVGIHAVIADQKHPQGIWTQARDEKDYEEKLLKRIYYEMEEHEKGKPKGFKLPDNRVPAFRSRKSRVRRDYNKNDSSNN